jgi:hypothetical protein
MIPDVQGELRGKRLYGEAKGAEDFLEPDTRDQLARYIRNLPTDYKLVVGVPSACAAAARRTLDAWQLARGIELVGL